MITVCSFWIDLPEQFPNAPDYLAMLNILDASCRRAGMSHIVMTNRATAPRIQTEELAAFVMDLPNNLMQASTEAHAQCVACDVHGDLLFVGADCLIRRDFRHQLPKGDLAIAYMMRHKRWRINNGFVYVPARSREKVAPLFRRIANDTSEEMFDDMLAFERAIEPMPDWYGVHQREGLAVNFLPLPKWNRYMAVSKRTPEPLLDAAEEANVLHFMGGHDNGKKLYFDWAARHGFA